MSLYPSRVVHELSGEDSNMVYRALDSYATHFSSGLTRDRIDRLLAKVGEDNRDAFLAEQSEVRGDDILSRLLGTPDAAVVADAADPKGTA